MLKISSIFVKFYFFINKKVIISNSLLLSICVIFLSSCTTAKYKFYPEVNYGIASWYGEEFHGSPTSSGEIFDMYQKTCAHLKYPFGTMLKVTNLSNNKSVYCLVNDRGPFISGRDIDLSYAAAREIELIGQGVGEVKIEYAGRDTSYIKEVRYLAEKTPYTIQVGSFREFSYAYRLKRSLELNYRNTYITEVEIKGETFYRVRIGKFYSKNEVHRVAKILANEGYPVFITGYEERI